MLTIIQKCCFIKTRYRHKVCWLLMIAGFISINQKATAQQNVVQQRDSLFQNPLIPGADPWVYTYNGYYFFMCTNGENITIRKTKNITDINNAKPIVVWKHPDAGANAHNIWAPELHRFNGKWYLYYSAGSSSNLSTQRCFVLENTSEDPTKGKWIDKGKIGDTASDFFSIDGSAFRYKNKNYFLWSGTASDTDNIQRIYIAEMQTPWQLKTHRIQISEPQYNWEKKGGQVNEGPEALFNNENNLFLTFSVSQCSTDNYALGLLKLKENGNPLQPNDWIKADKPVFGQQPSHHAFGPGHNGFFKSRDEKESWIIYHANSNSGQGCSGYRNIHIQKFTWSKDGFPEFGEPVNTLEKQLKPSGEF